MGGTRQWMLGAAVVSLLAISLTGCSSADSVLGATNGQAVAVGQEALGFTSSGGTSAGWTSPVTCPDSFGVGLRSSTPATETLTKLDPAAVDGPLSDPTLTTGYVATCVYKAASSTRSVVELAFFDIDSDHTAALAKRLTDGGWASGGATQSTSPTGIPLTETIYSKGGTRIVFATIDVQNTPALLIAG